MQTKGALASQLRKSFRAKCLCNLIFMFPRDGVGLGSQ